MSINSKFFLALGFITLISGCSKDEAILEEDMIEQMLLTVNNLRKSGCKCGESYMPPAPALSWNTLLEQTAAQHAQNMVEKGFFSHISPEGTSPIQRAQQAGYKGEYVGENIGKGYARIDQVMEAWKNSESHCKAMMDTLYTEMGAASYNKYWVQNFGRTK